MALIVKSRRAASARQSSVNATTACRPSVSTSRRRVVTSKPRPSATAVTVPCAIPVGTARISAACSASVTCSGVRGVARSISTTLRRRQRVAHRATDHARLGQRRHHCGQCRLRQEGRRRDSQNWRNRSSVARRARRSILPFCSVRRFVARYPGAARAPGQTRSADRQVQPARRPRPPRRGRTRRLPAPRSARWQRRQTA